MLKYLFRDLPSNVVRCFRGCFFLFHLAAILLTYFIVTSGFDWLYFLWTRSPELQSILFPAAILGGLLPLIGIPVFYIISRLRKDPNMLNTARALFQSGIIALVISSFYKVFTGRVPPAHFGNIATTDISHEFHFGFLREGAFWGWPSSHTTVAFAMAVTLFLLYPKNKWIRYAGLAYALYIGVGISGTIHWFSEFIAGALIGTAVGIVVGRRFLAQESKAPKVPDTLSGAL